MLTAQLAEDKKAENVIVVDLRDVESAPSDYFVIASCETVTQTRAVFDNILKNVKEYKLRKPKTEGLEGQEWIIIDFFDVVVHIMLEKIRSYYKLEKLWGDAKFSKVDDDGVILPIEIEEVISNYK
ncbi:MAG: ribosome silencing factor [Candidatus Kapaibacteriales bacterium]